MLDLLFYLTIFIFGLAIGSFLNCLIYRLEVNKTFLTGRSFCPLCRHQLNWQDLIPVLSFLILKGKCRYCRKKISWQYPLVEIATGILFVLTLYYFYFSFYYLGIISCLIVIFVYDLKHYIIPDKIIYSAIGITFLYRLFGIWNFGFVSDFGFRISDFKTLANPFSAAILASAFFLSIVLISKGRWMGLGDFKLAVLMGLFLGFPDILIALFSAFFIGAIIGLGLVFCGKKTLKSEVPFGPFLVTGTFIALFLGNQIIDWYLNLFF